MNKNKLLETLLKGYNDEIRSNSPRGIFGIDLENLTSKVVCELINYIVICFNTLNTPGMRFKSSLMPVSNNRFQDVVETYQKLNQVVPINSLDISILLYPEGDPQRVKESLCYLLETYLLYEKTRQTLLTTEIEQKILYFHNLNEFVLKNNQNELQALRLDENPLEKVKDKIKTDIQALIQNIQGKKELVERLNQDSINHVKATENQFAIEFKKMQIKLRKRGIHISNFVPGDDNNNNNNVLG